MKKSYSPEEVSEIENAAYELGIIVGMRIQRDLMKSDTMTIEEVFAEIDEPDEE